MSKLHNEVESLFNGVEVRRSRLGDQWLYAAVDVIKVLSDQPDPAEHWKDLKAWHRPITGLARHVKVPRPDGTWVELEMLNTEQVLRLVQSIDSPKAERIRLWLAETGQQRLEEAADPELAIKRTRTLYENKGYSRDWIQKRIRAMSARHELTGQWYRRGATESEQYRALTNELSRGTFGMDVEQYRRHKNLRTENLRDHMSDLEQVLSVGGNDAVGAVPAIGADAADDPAFLDVDDREMAVIQAFIARRPLVVQESLPFRGERDGFIAVWPGVAVEDFPARQGHEVEGVIRIQVLPVRDDRGAAAIRGECDHLDRTLAATGHDLVHLLAARHVIDDRAGARLSERRNKAEGEFGTVGRHDQPGEPQSLAVGVTRQPL